MPKTVVVGASPNPSRYSNLAVRSLFSHGIDVIAVGLRSGDINGVTIHTDLSFHPDVDTVTLYVGPAHQEFWKDYILSLKPIRVIFNPGTENPEFEKEISNKGIRVEKACTLVLLSTDQYTAGLKS